MSFAKKTLYLFLIICINCLLTAEASHSLEKELNDLLNKKSHKIFSKGSNQIRRNEINIDDSFLEDIKKDIEEDKANTNKIISIFNRIYSGKDIKFKTKEPIKLSDFISSKRCKKIKTLYAQLLSSIDKDKLKAKNEFCFEDYFLKYKKEETILIPVTMEFDVGFKNTLYNFLNNLNNNKLSNNDDFNKDDLFISILDRDLNSKIKYKIKNVRYHIKNTLKDYCNPIVIDRKSGYRSNRIDLCNEKSDKYLENNQEIIYIYLYGRNRKLIKKLELTTYAKVWDKSIVPFPKKQNKYLKVINDSCYGYDSIDNENIEKICPKINPNPYTPNRGPGESITLHERWGIKRKHNSWYNELGHREFEIFSKRNFYLILDNKDFPEISTSQIRKILISRGK